MTRTRFDKQYYDRFYRNPRTRAADKPAARRRAAFIAAYLKYLEIPVRRIVDVGCGLGHTLSELEALFPGAKCTGVEISEYLCDRYGWTPDSAVSFRSRWPFDLVVCNDVVGYLDNADAAAAIDNLATLTRTALFFGVLTLEDWDELADRDRTDPEQHLRSTRWYRRRLNTHFVNVGGGLFLKKPLEYPVWHLDRPG